MSELLHRGPGEGAVSSPDDEIQPFHLNVAEDVLADLQRRLAQTRWPDAETVPDSSQGATLASIRHLVDYWRNDYDWRRTEALLNSWGQYTTVIDGLTIHFAHIRSSVPSARPLLMSHGWPGSILEFRRAVEPLIDPVAHGGREEDAFHLILPSLPGYGFSGQPAEAGWDLRRSARAWATLMSRLGYTRWLAQGGDSGAILTAELGYLEAAEGIGLAGIHLNTDVFTLSAQEMDEADEEERAMLAEAERYGDVLSGYYKEMSTRPQTIGYSLADSPVGLASWIYTMFEDVGGTHDQHGDALKIFTLDEILDTVMLYWIPNTGASAARMYWEEAQRSDSTINSGSAPPIPIPTGLTIMPGEHARRSRRWMERRYSRLVFFNEVRQGGHFALLEEPGLVVHDIRETFRRVQ